jgi:hypothetical protein
MHLAIFLLSLAGMRPQIFLLMFLATPFNGATRRPHRLPSEVSGYTHGAGARGQNLIRAVTLERRHLHDEVQELVPNSDLGHSLAVYRAHRDYIAKR